jgi:transposase InsO family protein
MNNNKMERLNGEIRQREKTMRGLNGRYTNSQRLQIYHNYIREHEGLDGKTPAEACGITVRRNRTSENLIENVLVKAKSIV